MAARGMWIVRHTGLQIDLDLVRATEQICGMLIHLTMMYLSRVENMVWGDAFVAIFSVI
jgi:hypothetical protein